VTTADALAVIAPSPDSFRTWCWSEGLGPRDAVYCDSPADLEGTGSREVVIVDLMWCSGNAWNAALRAFEMQRDGQIAIRPGETPTARQELHRLVEAAISKARSEN